MPGTQPEWEEDELGPVEDQDQEGAGLLYPAELDAGEPADAPDDGREEERAREPGVESW